jgi:hypothetical protein
LTVPKNTVASIILKRKRFGTTKTLSSAGCPGKRALVKEVAKNPIGHCDRALKFLCGDGRTFQKDNHLCSHSSVKGT